MLFRKLTVAQKQVPYDNTVGGAKSIFRRLVWDNCPKPDPAYGASVAMVIEKMAMLSRAAA
jgi:hypothetical protein